MNIIEVCALLQLKKNEIVSLADIADAIGVTRQYVAKAKHSNLSEEKIQKIEKVYKVNIPRNYKIIDLGSNVKNLQKDELAGKYYPIPYWNEAQRSIDKLYDNDITEFCYDLQGIVRKLKCKPEDLKIISMFGEEMDGGQFPLKDGDLLIIDTAKKDMSESGIYFYSTLKGTKVFVRRLLEQMHGDVTVTVDNPLYAPMVNRTFTQEELDSIDFTVIGRVIKNMSLKL